jgi:hypothetical protein
MKEFDILNKHVFSDPRFESVSTASRVLISICFEYYIFHFLPHAPLLFLFYFKKLKDFQIGNKFIEKYIFVLALLQLCCKWLEDEHYSNKSIIEQFYSSKGCKQLTQMELEIFAALDYNMFVSKETYDAFVQHHMSPD